MLCVYTQLTQRGRGWSWKKDVARQIQMFLLSSFRDIVHGSIKEEEHVVAVTLYNMLYYYRLQIPVVKNVSLNKANFYSTSYCTHL